MILIERTVMINDKISDEINDEISDEINDELNAMVGSLDLLNKFFTEHGWRMQCCENGSIVFALPENPYSEFSLQRERENGKITVSVPMPVTETQYTTTLADYQEALAFLKTHLENFIEQKRNKTTL